MHGITALFGPSGAGKSVILRCISGLEHLAGHLTVGGEVWQNETTFRKPYDRPIGYVFQEASLFPHLSVTQNLLYGHDRALKAKVPVEIQLQDVVELMGIKHLLGRMTGALSGGEKQRAAIGRALLTQPRLLLMDEPLAALDQNNKNEILPYFEALHDTLSIPILYVSHDISEVERLADVLVWLHEGKVVASGPLIEMLADSRLPIARRPDAAAILEVWVKGYDPRFSLTEMNVGGETLLIPGRVGEEGKARRIRIAAADVSLAVDRPSQTSILNVLSARVKEIHPLGDAQVNVVLTIGNSTAGPALLARISSRAFETLNFVSGQSVYAQVKAVSLVATDYTAAHDDAIQP
jgi:molybdate transport system ATP-binding protein